MSPATHARLELRRMGMVGFATFHSPESGEWDGRLYRSLVRATAAAGQAQVLLVRTNGTLYRQINGEPICPVLRHSSPIQERQIDLGKRIKLRAASVQSITHRK